MSVESIITENLDVWTSAIKTKSTSGRGSSNKLELYGIKKLRELILELAIRGKLVPNDYADFSLKEHLSQLNAARLNLIESGALKKTKTQLPVSADEQFFEIPANWKWLRLADVYDVRDGTHDSPKPVESGYPLVTSKNLSSGKLDLSDVKYISEIDHKKIIERSKVDFGDILFAMIGSIGNPVIVDQTVEFSIKNVALFKYFDYEQSCPEYLKYYLVFASKVFKEQSSGGVQPFVSLGKLRAFTIPYPPLNEQIKIVEKLNDLMALCDELELQTEASIEAHQTLVKSLLETLTNAKDADELNESWQRISEHFDVLFTTEDSIDQLKQTILQLAVMGKLVKQDPNDEPASKLLERIAAEKEQLIKDKKIKKQKPLPSISDEEKPFDLPEGWGWMSLSEIGVFSGGKTPSKSNGAYWNGSIPWVTPKDMKVDRVYDSEDHVTQLAVNDGLMKIEPESILLVARSGILRRRFPIAITKTVCTVNQDLKVLNLIDKKLSEYVLLMMKGFERFIIENLTKVGTTVESLKFDEFSVCPFILPPFNEQERIVTRVEELLVLCDSLKEKLKVRNGTQLKISDALVSSAT
ncbi:restriction endonuclease subunit S [Alteromonas sp. S005]|uniref:restriction endonuclease subunit S n=1 Tax=Alteromonas sp. S005 TaxID=3117400 RepID=UPI002FDF6D3F